MKKLLLSFAMLVVAVSVSAQDLGESQLGKWTRPAATGIANVDTYIDACANLYQEAIDIRAAYDAITGPDMDDANNAISSAAGDEGENTLASKKEAYQTIIKRIEGQQTDVAKLPAMAESAVKSVPKNLKAPQTIKAINATKDAVKLAVEENAGVLKAATADIQALAGK